MSAVTIKLSKPIEAHGKTLDELTLREPVPEDLMQIGSPVLLIPSAEGDTGIEVRAKIIGAYIARLGNIPPSSVKAMSITDFLVCQSEILPFLQGG